MLFTVDVLPRFAVISTAVSASVTIAITASVTSISIRVKPRDPETGPRGRVVRRRSMSSPPHVGGGRDRARIREAPFDCHGDLVQVVERRGQGGDVVVALPIPVGAQHLVGGPGRMPP